MYPYSSNVSVSSSLFGPPIAPKLLIEITNSNIPCGLLVNGTRIASDNLFLLAEDDDSIVLSVKIDKKAIKVEKKFVPDRPTHKPEDKLSILPALRLIDI